MDPMPLELLEVGLHHAPAVAGVFLGCLLGNGPLRRTRSMLYSTANISPHAFARDLLASQPRF